jgi:HTH-type transcriptional regulator/antitoxin HigA
MSTIDKIETEADYDVALKRIEELWNAELNTPDGKELDALVTLVVEYEAIHYAIDLPSKEAALQFRREQSMLEGMAPYIAHDREFGESEEDS